MIASSAYYRDLYAGVSFEHLFLFRINPPLLQVSLTQQVSQNGRSAALLLIPGFSTGRAFGLGTTSRGARILRDVPRIIDYGIWPPIHPPWNGAQPPPDSAVSFVRDAFTRRHLTVFFGRDPTAAVPPLDGMWRRREPMVLLRVRDPTTPRYSARLLCVGRCCNVVRWHRTLLPPRWCPACCIVRDIRPPHGAGLVQSANTFK